jgi:hypothetical protein
MSASGPLTLQVNCAVRQGWATWNQIKMSAWGQKQTFAAHQLMSALHPIADMCVATRYFR